MLTSRINKEGNHNKDHSPGDREVHGQSGGDRAPPVAHADGDQGRKQGSLSWCPDYPRGNARFATFFPKNYF